MTIVEHAWCATTPRKPVAVQEATLGSGLKSVGSALDVLECFAVDGELGVSDIARRLGVAKSTAHRLLQTLVSRGFVEQDQTTGHYRLGIHLYELGQLALARNELRHAALSTVRQVAQATRLTVNFSVPEGADVVFVERIENVDGVRILGHFGRRLPSHCTSSGKVLAAFNQTVYRARLAAGFPPRLRSTVRTPEEWEAVVELVRSRRFAESHGESFDGASSVAVPVMNNGTAIASLSVFGPTEQVKPAVGQLVPLLTAASNRIAKNVGH